MNTRKLGEQEPEDVKFATAKGAHSLAGLRAMSWQDLMAPIPGQPARLPNGFPAGPRFGTVVDGYVLTDSVAGIFSQGMQNDVPTLTGWNADENGAVPKPDMTAEAFQKQAQQHYGNLAKSYLKI